MSKNENLHQAKQQKCDEFYTQYDEIERELNAYIEYDKDLFRDKTVLCPCDDPEWSNFTKYFVANFKRLGLKKLISTSYAQGVSNKQISLFESASDNFDVEKHETHGRIFVLDRKKLEGRDLNRLLPEDLSWDYLEGNGDFMSEEVTKLRDESQLVITNPPFTMLRAAFHWLTEKEDLKFAIIGNINAVTYKEVFPLIKENKVWIGNTFNKAMIFKTPYTNTSESNRKSVRKLGYDPDEGYVLTPAITWFTNIDFHKRHEELTYMTMEDNLRYNDKLRKKFLKDYGKLEYPHYDNYDAIEVPFSSAIPSDYTEEKEVTAEELQKLVDQGFKIEILSSAEAIAEAKIPEELLDKVSVSVETATDRQTDRQKERVIIKVQNPVMGVPITFLDKFNPSQFEIVGSSASFAQPIMIDGSRKTGRFYVQSKRLYDRILIRSLQ